MHVPVLDRHLQHPRIEFFEMRIDPRARLHSVRFDLIPGRPVARGIGGRLAGRRIDAAFKKAVERRMKRWRKAAAPRQNIPVEGLEMAEIKDQPVALGDGSRVKRFRGDQAEQTIGLIARSGKLGGERAGGARSWACGSRHRLH